MSEAGPGAPLVVLLHGLARGHRSFAKLTGHLKRAGLETWTRSYPSRRHPIPQLAAELVAELAPIAAGRPLYAVTHSLGGVVIRYMRDPRLDWRRIVMLAPPNQGSQLAAGVAHLGLFRWVMGPAGEALAHPSEWPEPPAPFAVIAGTRSRALTNPTSWTLARRFGPGVANDGTVAVAEARDPAMAAFAEVDATHTWIMNHPRVLRLATSYLMTGCF